MPIYPVDDMPFNIMREIKKKAVEYGLERMRRLDPSAKWIAREIMPGGATGPDPIDLELQNTTTERRWISAAAGMTADTWSQMLASANEEVPSNTMMILYGLFDRTPTVLENLNFVRFRRGSSDLDIWGTEHMYGHRAPGGNMNVTAFSDRIMQYLEEQNISIQLMATTGNLKHIGFRGYIFEKWGESVSPRDWTGSKYIAPDPTNWGTDPLPEITVDEIWKRKREVAHNLRQKLIDTGVVQRPDDIVVRETMIGGSNADVDIEYHTDRELAATQVRQGYDTDTAYTANQLGSLFDAGFRVPNNKAVGFYGFTDDSAAAQHDLTRIRFSDGSSQMFITQVEHCYAYPNRTIGGMFARPVYYEEREVMDVEVGHVVSDANARRVQLHSLIAERWGDNISKE